MKRRNFIKKSVVAGSAAMVSTDVFSEVKETKDVSGSAEFKLNFAPHDGMFKHLGGPDVLDQLNFIASQGFKAFEDNEMRNRPVDLQLQMAKRMQDKGIEMGVFVAHKIYWNEPNLASGNSEKRKEFLEEIKNSVEVAKRVKAKWMTVVPGHVDLNQNMAYQTANVVETLKQASAILEPHGIVMVLEPLNFRDHPGLFLTESPQAYAICKAVNSPSCKILFDIYHQQIQEGNLIPNIEKCWDEIAYFQIGDNPGRKEPTTGEINYKNVFKYIHSKGFKGILGMEHGNAIDGKKGEEALLNAYKMSSNF